MGRERSEKFARSVECKRLHQCRGDSREIRHVSISRIAEGDVAVGDVLQQLVFWAEGAGKAGGNSQGAQQAEHPVWKSKLSLFAPSWSQTLKCNWEKDAGKQSRNVQCLLGGQPKCNRNVTHCVLRGGRPDSTWPREETEIEAQVQVHCVGEREWSCPELPDAPGGAACTLPELVLSSLPWRPWGAANLRGHHNQGVGQTGLTRGPR